jgi:hypothetical protein
MKKLFILLTLILNVLNTTAIAQEVYSYSSIVTHSFDQNVDAPEGVEVGDVVTFSFTYNNSDWTAIPGWEMDYYAMDCDMPDVYECDVRGFQSNEPIAYTFSYESGYVDSGFINEIIVKQGGYEMMDFGDFQDMLNNPNEIVFYNDNDDILEVQTYDDASFDVDWFNTAEDVLTYKVMNSSDIMMSFYFANWGQWGTYQYHYCCGGSDPVISFSSLSGCIDEAACNYDSSATEDDGSCEYADSNADCSGDCLEGYTELTLMWSGAVDASMMTSFSVSGSANGELYSATLDTDSGSMTECWMTDLQADCFSIEIEGPDGLEWSIYSPLSDDPFLTGTNESMVMGSECTMGCMDMDACNYDSSAQMDDGSCEYADTNADCSGDCLEGYTELTLMWSGAVDALMMTSFSVSGSANGELYSATLDTDSGSMTECWMTDLQADCFSIEIEGPDGLEWSIYSPLSDDPFLTGTNESMVFGSECPEIWGCMDSEACNYNALATDDDGSCVAPNFENSIQCDECCMYSVGTWTHVNAFYLASSDTPTLSATAENWELSSAAFLYSEEEINADGSVTTISWFGADSDNSSMLTGDCYNGEITLVLVFKTMDDNIVSDIVIKMFDDLGMYFETTTTVDSFDLTTATMTGVIESGNSGTLIMIDSDGNGVGDCDETTFVEESNINHKQLIKTINLLGQDVDKSNKKAVLLYIYDDGTVEKKSQLR